jgi:hypothetical protein
MWTKSRNGIRKLDRALRRPLNHRCSRYAGKISPGARRPNYFAMACGAINQALRIHRRFWTDRYEPKPDERKIFLKWFHENYPS